MIKIKTKLFKQSLSNQLKNTLKHTMYLWKQFSSIIDANTITKTNTKHSQSSYNKKKKN